MNGLAIWNEVWKSVVVILGGMVLLRFAGRKSISQMTIPTTVIMISIGTVIVQPIAERSVWLALLAATVFVVLLIFLEGLQLRWNFFERVMQNKAYIVIKDGEIQPQALKKIRMTVDQLEINLRQAGIRRHSDVKTATIEPNGQLGYELLEDAAPVTLKQLKELLDQYFSGANATTGSQGSSKSKEISVFAEIEQAGANTKNKKLQ